MIDRLILDARITDPTKEGDAKFQDGQFAVDRFGFVTFKIFNAEKKLVGECRLSEAGLRAMLGFLSDLGSKPPKKRVKDNGEGE